jgi:hypothetical protein
MNNIKYMKEDKIDYVKKDAIIKKLKYENIDFDSDSDEEKVKPKVPEANVEYDFVDRSKGEYDCFPNYHSKGGY